MEIKVNFQTSKDKNSRIPSFGSEQTIVLYEQNELYYFPRFSLTQNATPIDLQYIQSFTWSANDENELSQSIAASLNTQVEGTVCVTEAFSASLAQNLMTAKVKLDISFTNGAATSVACKINFRQNKPSKTVEQMSSLIERLPTPKPDGLLSKVKSATSYEKPVNSDSKIEGFAAFDFGTSNSTVTIFDANTLPPARVISAEYFETLKVEMIQLFSFNELNESSALNIEWQALCSEIKQTLNLSNLLDQEISQSTYSRSDRLYAIIYNLEIKLLSKSDSLKKCLFFKLQEIYTKMSRSPSLVGRGIFIAHLDPADPSVTVIPSIVQVKQTDPLTVNLGSTALSARQQALNSSSSVDGQFHSSIKNCLFNNQANHQVKVSDVQGNQKEVSSSKLLGETLRALKDQTETWHASRSGSSRRQYSLNELVITYPTIAPPFARNKLLELAQDIGFEMVDMSYDEATASALFYIMQEYGNSETKGLSAFQSRSEQVGKNSWYQRIIILDIGGGTTDVAMLRLSLHEEDPFTTQDRGAGGKYYVLTPRLESSTGELQLGGDLISLKTFKLVKALIVDHIFQAHDQSSVSQVFQEANNYLPKSCKDAEDGSYIPRSIVEAFFNLNYEKPSENEQRLIDALNTILPTNWAKQPEDMTKNARNVFYQLWDIAEQLKRNLGAKQPFVMVQSFNLESLFLNLVKDGETSLWPSGEDLRVNLKDFEKVVLPHIEEAIDLAIGLIKNNSNESSNDDVVENADYKVDKIILSGQTCHLQQVQEMLEVKLSSQKQYIEKCFDSKYSKLSTSIGACYSHHMMQYKLDPSHSIKHLQDGRDIIAINVQNLHFNLPCSFSRRAQDDSLDNVFRERDNLQLLDPNEDENELGARRNEWQQNMTNRIDIYRRKSNNSNEDGILWGSFQPELLAKEVNKQADSFKSDLWSQIEVNQHLDLNIHLSYREAPVYTYRSTTFQPANVFEILGEMTPQAKELLEAGLCPVEISTNMNHGGMIHGGDTQFNEDQSFDKKITRFGTDGDLRDMICIEVEANHFNANNKLEVSASWAGQEHKTYIHAFERRKRPKNAFPMGYHMTLDASGLLALHEGEVPYLMAADVHEMIARPGMVYKKKLDASPDKLLRKTRDPFAGIH
jgi:hypothetical protein